MTWGIRKESLNVDGIDFGGASAVSVKEEASVEPVLSVALWNFLRGIAQKLSGISANTEVRVSAGQICDLVMMWCEV